jgi:predicted nucleic acid-binding protein
LRRWLPDTNVLSEIRRPRPSSEVISWLESLEGEQFCTSVTNIAELRFGAVTHDDTLVRAEITAWIDQSIKPWLENRIFPVDEMVLLNWRIMERQHEQERTAAPAVDLLIAAVAAANELGVATHDVIPFVSTGLPVYNPWTGECFNGA